MNFQKAILSEAKALSAVNPAGISWPWIYDFYAWYYNRRSNSSGVK